MRAVLVAASTYLACFQTALCADIAQSSAPATSSEHERGMLNPDRVSFYEVPLVCPAAPQIGCGSASKPLLLSLEHSGVVSEAWLNRAGTILAVFWNEQSKARERAKTLKAILEQKEMTAKKLTGDAEKQALKDFQSGNAWYRGAGVDRLSEEEAGIMAGRLIRKIRTVVTLTGPNSKAMQQQFTEILTRRLTGGLPDRDSTEKEILKICRQYLNEQEVSQLQEALKGFRPNRDEP